jgi:hypothetical protein
MRAWCCVEEKIRRRARRARGGFKIRTGRSRKWVRVFQEASKTHTAAKERLNIFFWVGRWASYSSPLRSCCVYTYTPSSPADCRLTLARFPTSSIVLLTVPDTHTEHCTHNNSEPSVCLVSTSCRHPWKTRDAERNRKKNFGAGRLLKVLDGGSVALLNNTPLFKCWGGSFSYLFRKKKAGRREFVIEDVLFWYPVLLTGFLKFLAVWSRRRRS